jgi:hypothetical protein
MDLPWDILGPDIASTGDRDTKDKKDVKGAHQDLGGLAYTSNVDQCRPTMFMSARSNSLMLTSGSKVRRLAIGAMRFFGSLVTRTLSCSDQCE